MMLTRVAVLALTPVVLSVFLSSACTQSPDGATEPGLIDLSLDPSEHPPSSPELLALGETTYEKECVACHGADGDGLGEAAYLLYPRPRDFTTGRFRLISTWDGDPTDDDLFRTMSRGMPGSAMPSWAHLSEETRWGLVHYLKTFLERPIAIEEPTEPASFGNPGTGIITIPTEPEYTPEAEAQARELYEKGCAPCHGETGRGDGAQEQIDSKGLPTRPRDLTLGVYKGDPSPEQVYRRIVAGLPGSPMPQSGYLHGDDGWHLVHLVRSMSSDEQRAKVEMKKFRIVATRVPVLPEHPDSGVWRSSPAVSLHLMPLWWRAERPEEITVKAVHDGQQVAMLLNWSDTTQDATAIRPQDFRDAAAIQFALNEDPPFFAMGQLGDHVNIWMWKSERQADLEPAFQDLEKVYPNIGIDSYPNLLRSPLEQPMRNALTLESDPRFVTAWGAGNIVADPTRDSAAEDLTAEGFGTLQARPPFDQAVSATGEYETGSYRVQFTRDLDTGKNEAVRLRPGSRTSVGFAVWNGSAGDRDGKKSITIWQELFIEP
ncbi:MAG: ethylbenzene dehydrogenase-related protein [Vicinamibacterales bacterium]|nr:ethylbenzene dehydrogenase-related protein [Vicinamibacterales bacterium]